jgi:hypothetical protein
MDNGGATRCGLPDGVEYRYILNFTDGPLKRQDQAPSRPPFNGPIECSPARAAGRERCIRQPRRHLRPFKAQYSTRIADKSSEMPGGSA